MSIGQEKILASACSGLSQSGWALHVSRNMGLTHFEKAYSITPRLLKYILHDKTFNQEKKEKKKKFSRKGAHVIYESLKALRRV